MMCSMFAALLGVACACMARAQVPGIPDSLLKNSDAVARLMSVDFVYNTPTSASAKFVEETTILNNTATDKGSFTCYVSPTSSLKNFSGTLCDAQGRTLRKFKRSDLKYTEFSGGTLASDIATYYLEVYAPSYPYTVRYEYEMAYKNGLFNFPTFIPVGSKGTALEKGVYTVSVPAGMQFRYKGLHIGAPAKESADGRDVYRWVLENVPAIKPEPASPPILDLVPLVFAVPGEFEYEKTRGSMCDWASYGIWQCGLLEGRNRLPEALRAEVHRRTDDLATAREKVRALYDYLGESTRYVSIQLGIGGQQPATAEEVFKTKFGDCKALSNYMHAMLGECGIESDYAIIHTSRRRMSPDFASPDQADHAILRVPLARDTLWLECTNTEVPFGYIHRKIAGHDAIVFRNGTGELVTLPQYADSLNRMVQEVEITISEDGSAEGHISERYETGQYEQQMGFPKMDEKKRTDYLLGALKIPMVKVSGITCDEHKEALPWIEMDYAISSPKYFNITGNRCFVPQTPFTNLSPYRDKERHYDIYVGMGYSDITTVRIQIPENMQVEACPRPCCVTEPFGSYSLKIDVGQGLITIEQRTCMHAGTYPRKMFGQYRDFITGRAKAFNANIVLKKQ